MVDGEAASESFIISEEGNGGGGVTDMSLQLSKARKIWRGYLVGQLANVSKAALWWSTFGILTVVILENDLALTLTRTPFNISLLLASPLAVAAAERLSIRKMLVMTTLGRFLVWSVLLPICWILFKNYLGWLRAFWVSMIILMFIDGSHVAFSNAVDIDCGGLDSLSVAYELPLTEFLRYRFTTIHQLVFDSSFILLIPPLVATLVLLSVKVDQWLYQLPPPIIGPDPSVFVLVVGIASVFAILSFISLRVYLRCIPKGGGKARIPIIESEHFSDQPWPHEAEQSRVQTTLWVAYKEKISEVLDGFLIVLSERALKWRLFLLAVETALEDSMVSVVIPMIALKCVPAFARRNEKTLAALVSVVVIAIGKLGGVIAGLYLASRWTAEHPHRTTPNRRLFLWVLLSSLSLILLPWGYLSAEKGFNPSQNNSQSSLLLPPYVGCGAILLGVFLFFIFSTAPKIGFATLIQNLVTHEDQAAKVFGFVGMFVTVTDGIMITSVNLIFYYSENERFHVALWVIFLFYFLHGLLEWTFGPQLVKFHDSNPSNALIA